MKRGILDIIFFDHNNPTTVEPKADFTGLVLAREEFQKFKNEKVSTDAEFPHLHLHRPKIRVSVNRVMRGLGI